MTTLNISLTSITLMTSVLAITGAAHAGPAVAECLPADLVCTGAADQSFGTDCSAPGSNAGGQDYGYVAGFFGSAGAIGYRGCSSGPYGSYTWNGVRAGAGTDVANVFIASGSSSSPGWDSNGTFVRVLTPVSGTYAYWYDYHSPWTSGCSTGAGTFQPQTHVGRNENAGCPLGDAPDPMAGIPWGTLLP